MTDEIEFANALQITAANLAALDLAEQRARRDEIETDISQIDIALIRGEEQIRDTTARLDRAKRDGPDGGAAAAELLAGGTGVATAGTVSHLQAELETLKAGVADLRDQKAGRIRMRHDLPDQFAKEMGPAVQPLVDEIIGRTKAALAALAQAFVDARALGDATGNVTAKNFTNLYNKIEPGLWHVAEAGLIARGPISVSGEVIALLEANADAIRLAGGRLSREIGLRPPR